MSLTDIVKKTKRSLALGAVGVAGLLANVKTAEAATINVDPSWTYTEINNVLDGNPGTLGKDGQTDAVSGDTVLFGAGTYQLPQDSNASFRLQIDGVNLQGNSSTDTFLQPDPFVSSPVILRVYSVSNTIDNFTLQKTNSGGWGVFLDADFDPPTPVTISNCILQNLEEGVQWTNKEVLGDNSTASVFVTDNYFLNTDRGNIFNEASGEGIDSQRAWVQVSGNTFENMSTIALEPPTFPDPNGVASSTVIGLGVGSFDNNLIINSDGITMQSNVVPSPQSMKRSAQEDSPGGNGEFNMAISPPPGYIFVDYLENLYPGSDNFSSIESESLMLTDHRRLLPGSPSIGPQFVNTDGSIRGYSGAFPPAGDVDKNGLLTLVDFSGFRLALNSQDPTLDQIKTHDFVEPWNTIDRTDADKFTQGYLNSNGSFPDCNQNTLNDLEEILDADELGVNIDVDNDGIIDSCCSPGSPPEVPAGIYSTLSPSQNFEGVESMRYLSFVTGTNPGQQTALRIQTGFNELDEPTYHYVQEPNPLTQASGSTDDSGTTFLHSRLDCEPFHTDWSQYAEPIYVSGESIIPSRLYDVQAVDQVCGTALEGNFSAPYTIGTSQWGDLTDACGAMSCGAPNGSSDFDDISAIVDKFKNLPVSPHKASADVAPGIPDQKVDFTDIPAVVDGFRGLPYSYATSGGC